MTLEIDTALARESSGGALGQLRLKVLNRILWVALTLGALAAIVGGYAEFLDGNPYSGAVYLVLYLVGLIAAFVRRLGYKVRAILFLGILYFLAVSEMWLFGKAGLADACIFAFVVFASVFFSLRTGALSLVLGLLTFGLFGYLHVEGLVTTVPTTPTASQNSMAWVTSSVALAFLAGAALAMVGLLLRNLEQREAHFRSLIEDSSDVITVIDAQGCIQYTSPAVSLVLGVSPEQCVGRDFFERLHPDDVEPVRDALAVVDTPAGRSGPIECRLRHQDTSWVAVEITGKSVAEPNRPLRRILNYRDVTERRRTQEELRLSQERTRELNRLLTILHEVAHELAAFEDVDQLCRRAVVLGLERLGFERLGIWLVEEGQEEARGTYGTDEHGNVRDERGLRVPGWDTWVSERLVDRNIAFDFQPGVELIWEGKSIGKADSTRASMWDGAQIIGFLCADNLLSHRPFTDEQNRILALYASTLAHLYSIRRIQDERKHLELQLQHAQRMEAIGQLAGGVAHDFNNLLQAIQGYTDIAMRELAPESRAYADLAQAGKAIERAGKLVRQLLAFSRREIMQPEHLDLAEVVGNLTTMLRRLIGEHIELAVTHAPDLKGVYADPGQIEQVLMNLCVNARDAMPHGGRITIETSNALIGPEDAERHPWAKEGSYVLLTVSDTGVGMTQEIAEHVFEPFFTTKEVGQGTGMGLATTYGIVKQHDGMIHVYSELGHGTIFRVYLPVSDARGVKRQEPKPEEEPVRGGRETILLAEDEEFVREVATRVLEEAGYRVLAACDGAEAIRLFEENRDAIDLSILDVVMPKKSGRAVFDRIKAVRPAARVLFSSGYSYRALEASSLPEGGFELIQKPYAPSDLLRRVRAQIDKDA